MIYTIRNKTTGNYLRHIYNDRGLTDISRAKLFTSLGSARSHITSGKKKWEWIHRHSPPKGPFAYDNCEIVEVNLVATDVVHPLVNPKKTK